DASDSTKYLRFAEPTLDKDLNGIDPVGFSVSITATNFYDAAAPAAPSAVSYTIFDNVDAPRAVSAAMVGMHFKRWPSATNPADPSDDPTYGLDAVRIHDTEGTAWADVQVSNTGAAADFSWSVLD